MRSLFLQFFLRKTFGVVAKGGMVICSFSLKEGLVCPPKPKPNRLPTYITKASHYFSLRNCFS